MTGLITSWVESANDPDGDFLYGIEIFVDPNHRGMKIGERFYRERNRLCKHLRLKGIVFGGRLPLLAENIGKYKKKNNISILQSSRWNEILEQSMAKGREQGLSDGFVTQVLTAIHQESINHQERIMLGESSREEV